MSAHRLGIAAVALLGMAASATSPPRPVLKHPAQTPGAARLMAFGGRSAAQLASGVGGKLDAALADLTRHAGGVRPDHALEDLHSLSPAARFMQRGPGGEPLVAIDAVTRGDPQRLKDALVSLGLEHPAVFRNDVGGWLPVSAIEAAATRAELTSLRAALSRARGAVATQGDFAQGTAALRAAQPGLDGSGVTVGILSVSYNCYSVYAANQGQSVNGVPDPPPSGNTGYAFNGFTADAASDVSTGALPAGVEVLAEAGGGALGCIANFGYPLQLPFTDEGRAMLQIVHAVAPGAALSFYTADNSEADFANGIQALANAGAKVIADDVGYFDEPFFQDGLLTQAVDTVAAKGVAYFSAAGNDSNLAYDNTAPQFTIVGSGPQSGENLLNFDASGNTSAPALTVNVPAMFPGEFIAVVLEWDQPYLTGAYPGNAGSTPGASSALDLCVSGAGGNEVLDYNNLKPVSCTGANALGTDPVQILIIANPANASGNTAATTVSISVGLLDGSLPPGRIKLAWEDDGAGSTITNFPPTSNGTIQGHPGAAGAAAVGAAVFFQTPLCGLTPASLEAFSSFGGTPILFDASGNRLPAPVMRQKPDFVAADGVNTTFFGFTLAAAGIVDSSSVAGCANAANYPNYFGTSAAAPHAAGLAALMLQANSTLTPAQIISAMQKGAAPMDNPSPDAFTGYGFLQADAAMAQLPAGPPAISVSPSTINVGQSATLSWASFNTSSCNSSWGGAVTTRGSTTVSPAATGSDTYTLTCSNPQGPAATSSATLTVNAAPPSGGKGGGGALGELTLLALAGLGFGRARRAARARKLA